MRKMLKVIRRKKPLCWVLPCLFTLWMAMSWSLLSGLGGLLPVWVTNLLSVAMIPSLIVTPILKSLGFALSNAAYSGPTDFGIVIATLIFDVALYGLGFALDRMQDLKKR
ncbi:MAG: hypothetical protein ACJ763_03435 [Bdellovibrionia bacterium]